MRKILGYGEDALTYWALTKKLDLILKELEDDSQLDDCLVLYRPSFGRGKTLRKPTDRKAEFGEFDAILVTTKAVYLIESKWDNLLENRKVVIELNDVQILRHKIFSWYYNNWKGRIEWNKFVERYENEFEEEFGKWRRKIAPSKSLLSENLQYLLNQMHNPNKELKNLLLYFYRQELGRPSILVKSGKLRFLSLPIGYQTVEKSNYIEII
jgi:hypothetical protein